MVKVTKELQFKVFFGDKKNHRKLDEGNFARSAFIPDVPLALESQVFTCCSKAVCQILINGSKDYNLLRTNHPSTVFFMMCLLTTSLKNFFKKNVAVV
ncbi:MAG: hypothetical protein ABI151_08200 [Chitinophagaceae bacterium]